MTPNKNKANELKTLKDLEIGTEDGDVYSCDLKQEAIKWIKKIESGEEVDVGTMSFKWDEKSPYTGAAGTVLIDFIKHFFNITEEDLK